MKLTGSGGFTLVEMLVILVLITICTALVYPTLLGIRNRFDTALETATVERNRKKENFAHFIRDGLPPKNTAQP